MEIDLQADSDMLRFSKHFLIKGWGLKEQSKTESLQIHHPENWNLFSEYLRAMGNLKDDKKAYDLRCFMQDSNVPQSKYKFLMVGVAEVDLRIDFKKNDMVLRTWNFALPNTVLSHEVLELSFFLSLTDCIKSGLL